MPDVPEEYLAEGGPAASTAADGPSGPEEAPFNLLHQWWFYALLFVAIWAFTVAIHLYFDYAQWHRDKEKAEARQAAANAESAGTGREGGGEGEGGASAGSADTPGASDKEKKKEK